MANDLRDRVMGALANFEASRSLPRPRAVVDL